MISKNIMSLHQADPKSTLEWRTLYRKIGTDPYIKITSEFFFQRRTGIIYPLAMTFKNIIYLVEGYYMKQNKIENKGLYSQ